MTLKDIPAAAVSKAYHTLHDTLYAGCHHHAPEDNMSSEARAELAFGDDIPYLDLTIQVGSSASFVSPCRYANLVVLFSSLGPTACQRWWLGCPYVHPVY